MSFLKKLGQVLSTLGGPLGIVAGVVSGFLPQSKQGQVAKVVATTQNDLSVIAGVIANVEAVGATSGLTGAQKLAAAIPQVGQALASTALMLNHKIADQALYDKGVAELTQATVDILNALHQDGVQTQNVGS